MAQFAQLFISGDFASGVTYYEDYYPNQRQSVRVVLPVILARRLAIHAIVDTGAPWCILDPEVVDLLGATVEAVYIPGEKLLIRGTSYEGKLLRISIGLLAEFGDTLEVDATVFVPVLTPGNTWPHPNFIGLDGFLNRIRFAVDPTENAFYFGSI